MCALTEDPFVLMDNCLTDSDRSSPLAFIGRNKEVKAIRKRIARVAEAGTASLTTVLYGLPGAGKTSLLSECARRFNGEDIGGRRVWFARIRPENLAQRPQDLCASICESLRRKAKHPKLADLFRTSMSILSDKVTGRSFYEQHNASHGLGGTVGYADCFSAYQDSGMWGENNAIVLLLDEAQLLADFQSDKKTSSAHSTHCTTATPTSACCSSAPGCRTRPTCCSATSCPERRTSRTMQ